jgi:hypothetical protein
MTFPFHPAYGLPDSLRFAVVQDAERDGVAAAAARHRVAVSSVYRWKKALRDV